MVILHLVSSKWEQTYPEGEAVVERLDTETIQLNSLYGDDETKPDRIKKDEKKYKEMDKKEESKVCIESCEAKRQLGRRRWIVRRRDIEFSEEDTNTCVVMLCVTDRLLLPYLTFSKHFLFWCITIFGKKIAALTSATGS